MENLLNASTKSFGEVIKGEKKFIVPMYQRNYSWDEPQWEDLWNDIINAMESGTMHYMGSLVLLTNEDEKKSFYVTDGQQRLTTLSLVILAAIKQFKLLIEAEIDVEENTQRVDLLLHDYIGTRSKKSLNFTNKLALNEINDPFYSTYLVNFRDTPNPKTIESSNKQLLSCYKYFYDKIDTIIFKDKDVNKLIDFEDFVSNNLIFIDINPTNDLNAYLIFETLNDRGLELSITDLLKNYLFSMCDTSDHKHIKNIWDEIIKNVSYEKFPKFIRHFWLTKNRLVQEKDLFKAIRTTITIGEDAFKLLAELRDSSPVYSALLGENDSFISDRPNLKEYIDELRMFRVTQCFPLLLSIMDP